jgi:hypothetical protein
MAVAIRSAPEDIPPAIQIRFEPFAIAIANPLVFYRYQRLLR